MTSLQTRSTRVQRPLPSALWGLLCATILSAPAAAQGLQLSATAASGDHGVSKYGVILAWNRAAPLWQGQSWQLLLRHEVELAAWRVKHARNLIEAGYSPVFRLQRPLAGGGAKAFFIEGSIGVRALSHTRITPDRSMGSALHFSDMLGLGWQWGPQGRSSAGVRIQHLSNGGVKKPNPGINFGQIYYSHRF